MDREVPASRFKERCLALLDEVARTKTTLIVTKRGRPVAKVVALEEHEPRSLAGSVTYHADDEELLFSTGEAWEADND